MAPLTLPLGNLAKRSPTEGGFAILWQKLESSDNLRVKANG